MVIEQSQDLGQHYTYSVLWAEQCNMDISILTLTYLQVFAPVLTAVTAQ